MTEENTVDNTLKDKKTAQASLTMGMATFSEVYTTKETNTDLESILEQMEYASEESGALGNSQIM